MNKRDIQKLLDAMPEEIDTEELMYRIYVLKKIEAAEEDLRAGRYISHEELVRRSKEWLK